MKITCMFLTKSECTFVFDEALKHLRPNFDTSPMVFRAFPQNEMICPVTALKKYLDIRLTRSSDESLFITTTKPYRQASCDTIARWIKTFMSAAGIDTGKFQAHSVRSASTSAANFEGISLKVLLKSASWSGDSTFKRFYRKEIDRAFPDHENRHQNYGTMILNRLRNKLGK